MEQAVYSLDISSVSGKGQCPLPLPLALPRPRARGCDPRSEDSGTNVRRDFITLSSSRLAAGAWTGDGMVGVLDAEMAATSGELTA
jgi:hypothetical protein